MGGEKLLKILCKPVENFNQKLSNHHSRILETIYFHSFDVLMLILFIQLFVGGFIMIQDFNHTNNRGV